MSHIFISYAHDDRAFVEDLFESLDRVYQYTWFDKELTGGEVWWEKICSQIAECEIFLIVLSKHWTESHWGSKEYEFALEHHKKLLPVRIEPIEVPQSLKELQPVQYVDIPNGELTTDNLTELYASISRLSDEITEARRQEQEQRKQEQERLRRSNSRLRLVSIIVVLVGLIVLLSIAGLLIAFSPPFQGEIVYISSGINQEIRLLEGGLPGSFRKILNQGPIRLPGIVAEDSKFELSPDGKQVAFASRYQGNLDLYIANSDGSNPRRLTENVGENRNPSWSPDGTQIAFASNRDGNWEIYRMNADGTSPQNLTQNPEDDDYPAWSHGAGGRYIAFMSKRDGNWEIYRMDIEGNNLRRLTDNPADDQYPAWSPDGHNVAFDSNRVSESPLAGLDVDAGGLNPCRLITHDIFITDFNGSPAAQLFQRRDSDERFPSWSPDGKYIVFSSDRRGDNDLYIVPAQVNIGQSQGEPILLTEDRYENDLFPIWLA